MRDTRQVIDTYYQTSGRDWDAWLTLFDSNVVLEDQLEGQVEGIEAVRGVVDRFRRGYSRFQMTPLHITIEDDHACVVWHCRAANATGVPIDARGANYFHIVDGKIVRMADFHDTVPFEPYDSQDLS
ncbi:MAG: nuclear transport factor 2 family protein [Egibacteraceae bacterium]